MKTILYVSLLCIMCLDGFAAITPKIVPKPEDVNSFYPYFENVMTLSDFQEALEKFANKKDRVFKLPVSYLKKYGITRGTKIQSIDFKTGRKEFFEVKDFVYGILPPDGQRDNVDEKHKLRIILSDRQADLDKLSSLNTIDLPVTGFSYIGNDRKLFVSKERLIPTTPFKGKLIFEYVTLNSKDAGYKIRTVDLAGNQLLIRAEAGLYEPYLKMSDGYYSLSTNYSILTRDLKFAHSSKWGDDSEVLLLQAANDVHACFSLYFISKDNVSHVPLPCSVKGR